MSKTRLISPGSIPNHSLLKNLELQDNYISNDGGDEGIRITDAGIVGINNPAPGSIHTSSTLLEISQVSGGAGLVMSSYSAGTGHAAEIIFQKSGTATVNTYGDGAGTAAGETLGSIQAWGTTQDSTAADDTAKMSSYIAFTNDSASREGAIPGKISFATTADSDNASAAIRMIIKEDGNIGIGNTVPGSILEISKVSGAATLELSSWSATATESHAGKLKFQKSGTATLNTFTAGDHTTAGEILGRIEAWGVDDADGETLSSYIEFANDAVSDADSSPGKIIFATSDANDAGTPTPRLTIDDSGVATFENFVTLAGGSLKILEKSSAATDIAAYGQIWVKTATPNELYFTNDAGNDIQLSSGSISVAEGLQADNITEGTSSAVSIGTSAAYNITFTDTDSAEWLVFNTNDIVDAASVPVTEILGKDDQRLRIRNRGADNDLQLFSERNIEMCVVQQSGAGGDYGDSIRYWRDRTPTTGEKTLSAAWEINQGSTTATITQVADQDSTSIPAQQRGSTSGVKCLVYYETDGSGNPTFRSNPDQGGNGYTDKFEDDSCDYNHFVGLNADGSSGDSNVEDRSTIIHDDDDGAIKLFMSVEGTGIPTGAYVGEVVSDTCCRIHVDGGTGAVDTDDRVATTTTATNGTLTFRDRVCFQDGGSTSSYAVLQVEKTGQGFIHMGMITEAGQALGKMQVKGIFEVNVIEDHGEVFGIYAANSDLRLGSYGQTNRSLTTLFDTIWLSNASTENGLPGYTTVQLGTRAFVGNSACNQNRMRFDGDDDNRVIQITANDVSTSDELDATAWNMSNAGGCRITVAKTSGTTNIDTSGNLIIDAEGGTLTLKNSATGSADTVSIQSVEDVEIVSQTTITLDAETNIILDANGGDIALKDDGTTIATIDLDGVANTAQIVSATGKALRLGGTSRLEFNSAAGKFTALNAGTQFSVADSAFAGMILGYTTIGIDAPDDSQTLSTGFVVPSSAHKVKFVAPPSGVVEIFVSIHGDFNRRAAYFGLSDNSTYNTLDVTHEHIVVIPPSAAGDRDINHRWVITGLTSGTAYEYWFGAKSSHIATTVLRWGGNATGEFQPFIMKATALPTAVADYAVYG